MRVEKYKKFGVGAALALGWPIQSVACIPDGYIAIFFHNSYISHCFYSMNMRSKRSFALV